MFIKNKPKGLEHHKRDFANIKIKHWLINEHQQCFPELAEKMRKNPDNATNIYSAFIAIIILKITGRLTTDKKVNIMKEYKVL